ncbi:MBL fold metallo-hydrolase [Oceanobacillus damuensis]|uniref:MBL fold metallo-hydrolase n=1 Tax=Oceanobacillus damuensis TaxID=937928 RepID=UPI0008377CF5|nr:MBL fold metallo-hydrolase [Oceanobacillus damuensis]
MKIIDENIIQLTLPTPFAVGDVHVYLMKGDTLTLIDAGAKTIQAKDSFVHQLKKIGYGLMDIEQIVLTHHHPDHTGLIEEFPRLKHIMAHQEVDLWLTMNSPFLRNNEKFFEGFFILNGVPEKFHPAINEMTDDFEYGGRGSLSGMLKENDTIPAHPDWRVIETKGHAQTHLSFVRDSDGLIIGGDHLIKHISPNPMIEAPIIEGEERQRPMLDYRDSLKKCSNLELTSVLPGHGEIFSGINELISKRLVSQEKRAEKVYRLIKSNSLTPYEICTQLFPKYYEKQINLTMSETIGQLDYLLDEKLIDYSIEDGILIYYAK